MRLAIVIPTLDEEEQLPRVLLGARRVLDESAGDLLVVCDGGSRDRTRQLASAAGAMVVECDPGRGVQLARGAHEALASGVDALLFLHADTLLPDGARDDLERALATSSGGGFTLRFVDAPWIVATVGSKLVCWRTRWLRVPLGDQAQFLRAEAYRAVGGLPPWQRFEDLEMLRRLRELCRRRGERLAIINRPVRTSGRRFRHEGVLRSVARNWWVLGRLFFGASLERMSRAGDPRDSPAA